MSQVTLVRVLHTTQDTKYGMKPKVAIKTEEHGDKWLSSFKVAGTEDWKEGETVEVDIQEKGDFINFTPRTSGSASTTAAPSSNLEARVAKLEATVFGNEPEEDVIQADDLPDMDDEELGNGF